jgi:threonine/homoserine/homoserine lactone efflux protein
MKLLLSGVAIAIFASLVFSFFLSVYPQFRPVVKGSNDLLHSTGISLTAFAILGFIVSLIGLINAKVKNKHLGNFLELLVIVSAAAFFIYFATR